MSEDPTKRFPKDREDNGEDKLDRLFAAVEALRSELRSEVSSLRSELRSEVSSLRSELHTEVSSLRSELHAEVSSLRSELATLSETVEHRLYDTRPIWETVLAEMENLKNQVSALENRVVSLETTVHNDVKDLAYVVRGQYVDVIRVQRDFDERLTALEQKPA